MSCTRSFNSNPRFFRFFGLAFLVSFGSGPLQSQGSLPSAVSSQANMDAAAQRRLQDTAREAQRQRRVDEQIRLLAPALSSENLAASKGPVLTRKAIAALATLRREGISPEEAFSKATRAAGIGSNAATKPIYYLRTLFLENSGKITPEILAKLAAGEDPSPNLILPAYLP